MVRRLSPALVALMLSGAAGCGGRQPAADVPPQAAPLPVPALAGQVVTIYPLTLMAAADALGWEARLAPREAALALADSVIGEFVTSRAPEVRWVLPDAVRRAARRAPGVAPDPDQLATAVLRDPRLDRVPDPLRYQMRSLTGLAGDRYALVPASLAFLEAGEGTGVGRAELSLVLTDVRLGAVVWRTVARGEGTDPWRALSAALTTLVPDLP